MACEDDIFSFISASYNLWKALYIGICPSHRTSVCSTDVCSKFPVWNVKQSSHVLMYEKDFRVTLKLIVHVKHKEVDSSYLCLSSLWIFLCSINFDFTSLQHFIMHRSTNTAVLPPSLFYLTTNIKIKSELLLRPLL